MGDTSLHNQARLLRAIETGTFRRVGGTRDIRVKVRIIAATNRNLTQETAAGRFRRDLYHRLNAFELRLPPLRERRPDIPVLAEYFRGQAQERLQKSFEGFSVEALQAMQQRPWPGNVRELRNVVERAVVVAHGARITLEDLYMDAAPAAPEENEALPTLAELERRHIARAVALCEGNIPKASEMLGIGRSTLYRKVADYGIVWPPPD